MAGKSHEYSMNINIKAQADGIGKTNSEITQLANEVKGIDGKNINLKINLGGNAGKDIQSVVKSIGSIEKSLNTLSGKGLQSIEQGMSTLTKAANDVVSAVGSIQKSLDGLSGRGPESVASSMGDITKSSTDASSAVGQVSTAADGISTGNAEELAAALSEVADMAQQASSAVGRISDVGGLGDNWNNSYGGRYGGMRYTGQGKGISDLVSFIGNGKSSYELTIENAMNKTRNMGVAKAWKEEDGVTGMDAYWALDAATDRSLMSLNALAAGINATAATTGATAKDLKKHAMEFGDFGTMVMGLGYTEDVAQTAIMKLGRGLHGTFAALDQYGITRESLTSTGLWSGDENDLDGYMAAVSEFSTKMADQLLQTPTGQMATLSKSASLGGYALGQMEAEQMTWLIGGYKQADDWLRKTTKGMGWGAKVRDNLGNRVLSRTVKSPDNIIGYDYNPETGQKDIPVYGEQSVSIDANGNVVDDYGQVVRKANGEIMKEQDAIAEGYSQKMTGVGLSTLIIGADQVISTYKTLKDTILGAYAEWRDLRRIRQIGLKGIFDESQYRRNSFGNFEKIHDSACSTMNEECPANGGGKGGSGKGKNKKKKGRFGRWKDSISSKIDNIGTNATNSISNTKKGIGSRFKNFKNKFKNPHNIISNSSFDGYDKPIGPKLSNKKPLSNKSRYHYYPQTQITNAQRYTPNGVEKYQIRQRTRRRKNRPDYVTTDGSSSAKFYNDPNKGKNVNTDTFRKWKKEGLQLQKARELNEKLDKQNKSILNGKDSRYSNFSNKISNKVGNFKNGLFSKKENLSNYFSSNNKEREKYANQYGGYMKRTNKLLYDKGQLTRKAKNYIKTKKDLLQKEFASGQLSGLVNKKILGDKGRQFPYKIWDGVKSGASSLGSSINTRLSDSFLGTQYGALKRQGSTVKNAITGSGAWSKARGVAGGIGSQIWGNTGALYGMATGKDINKTRAGKAVQSVKKNGVVGAVKQKVSPMVGKTGQKIAAGGGKVLGGVSKGVGAMAGGLGKIGGLVGGIGGAFMGLLGPIGAVIMGVTLLMGLCDALGIDLSPLQEAFGGFMEALQPAIQGLNEWIAGFAKELGPVLTQLGQALGPILQAIGGLISGGLGALAGILGPILEGIGAIFSGGSGEGMFNGLAEGLAGLGPVLQNFWNVMGQGAEGVGGFLGGVFDGIGQFLTHVVQEWANTITMFWTTIAQGISTAVSTVATAISNAITTIATTVSSSILLVASSSISAILGMGGAIGGAILLILGKIATGIMMIGNAVAGYILTIGTVVAVVVTALAGAIAGAVSGIGMAIAGTITAISAAIIMGITGLATAITSGILMISMAIIQSFAGFAMSVAAATAAAYATLLAFQGSAVGLMSSIATDMVNAFKNNFTGIAAAVDSEMAGAYQKLCEWGDKMVAKAGQIGRDASAAYKNNSGIGSPGYIWLMTAAEWFGALGAMTKGGAKMVTMAASIGKGIVSTFISSHPNDAFQETFGLDSNKVDLYPEPIQFSPPIPVSPPIVKEPKLSKDIRQQKANATSQSPVFNYNHYGDVDNEERMQKTMKYFSEKIDFENKRANRTV